MRNLYDQFYRRKAFYWLQAIRRRPFQELFEQAVVLEQWDAPRIRAWQWQRVLEMLRHARSNVPYYQESLSDPDRLRNWDDFATQVPLLDKPTVQADARRFVATTASGPLKMVRTSGSTGRPLVFFGSRRTSAMGLATMMRARRWWGVDYPERSGLLIEHGHKFDPGLRQRVAIALRPVRERLANRIMLSAYNMTDTDLRLYYERLLRFKPRYLIGYATALYLFARYVAENGLDGKQLGLTHVFYTSEMLYGWQRRLIEDTFGVRVAREYGMVEMGVLAHECPSGSNHVMDDMVYLETLPVPGEPGLSEIVVTTLQAYAAPLIRYRTGDLVRAEPVPENCDCGLGLTRIGTIEGRSHDLLVSPSGRVLHGQVCSHIINHAGNVRRFQLVQHDYDHLLLRIECDISNRRVAEDEIRSKLREMFDSAIQIDFEYPTTIEVGASGKFRWVQSKVAPLNRKDPRQASQGEPVDRGRSSLGIYR